MREVQMCGAVVELNQLRHQGLTESYRHVTCMPL